MKCYFPIKIAALTAATGSIVLCALFFISYHYHHEAHALTTAEMNTKLKTLAFHVLQSQSVVTSGSFASGDVTVFVGEQNPVIKNAEIEVEGVTDASSNQNITVDITQSGGTFPTPRAQSFSSINSSGGNNDIILRYNGVESGGNDLATYLAGIITSPSPYTFTVKIRVNGASVSLLKAKLIITYQFAPPSNGPTIANSTTGVYKAFQNTGVLSTGNSVTNNITVFVGDPSPVVKSAYLVVRGISKSNANQNITVDIKQPSDPFFPTPRSQQFTINNSGKDNLFSLLYAGSSGNDLTNYLAGIITAPTEYTFNIKIGASGADVSLIQAWLVIVYQFSQTSSGFPATGNIVSSTLDTYAINGATYNSILWKGTLPLGTKVRLQLASSDNSNGPFTFIGGTTCSSNDYYESTSDQAVDIKCFSSFNNKRYFRYKAILCSYSDCTSSGSQTPQIDDVIVNWSP